MIVEYTLAESLKSEYLAEAVNRMLDEGWELHGPTILTVVPDPTLGFMGKGSSGPKKHYAQALVRRVSGGKGS